MRMLFIIMIIFAVNASMLNGFISSYRTVEWRGIYILNRFEIGIFIVTLGMPGGSADIAHITQAGRDPPKRRHRCRDSSTRKNGLTAWFIPHPSDGLMLARWLWRCVSVESAMDECTPCLDGDSWEFPWLWDGTMVQERWPGGCEHGLLSLSTVDLAQMAEFAARCPHA